jgi:hypothetical protein
MFNEAVVGQGVPGYVSTKYGLSFKLYGWRSILRIPEVDEITTVPHTLVFAPFVERLIGPTRREFLDWTLFWNGLDLERNLAVFAAYYNAERVHLSLGAHTPLGVSDKKDLSIPILVICAGAFTAMV